MKSTSPVSRSFRQWLVQNYGTVKPFLPNRYFAFHCDGGRIYLNLKETLGMFRRALGVYEWEKMDAIRRFLQPGSTFIDVGGNIGDFSLLASKVVGGSGKVLCFEPEPNNCKWIQRNIGLNGYKNISVLELALSDTEGEAQLYLGARSDYHSLVSGLAYRDAGVINVRKRTLDAFLRETGQDKVDMIKVDVEGAELQVLKGASNTLDTNPSVILLLELHPHLGVPPKEVCNFLLHKGFSFYQMAPPFDVTLPVDDKVQDVLARR